jgi:hypothetical protein
MMLPIGERREYFRRLADRSILASVTAVAAAAGQLGLGPGGARIASAIVSTVWRGRLRNRVLPVPETRHGAT